MEIIQGKNILIVGATGGIGHETAKLLKQSGGNLFLAGRDSQKLMTVAQGLQVPSDQVFNIDFEDESSVAKVADAVHAKVGQLDILINAAGIGIIKPLETLTVDDLQQTLQANLIGPFMLFKYIPGVLGKTPMAVASAYAAAMYGLNGMLKSIREELRRTNIRITNLYLGGVDSAFWDEIDMRVQRDKFITAKEAGRAVWFLCQQPSSGVVSEMVIQPFNHQAI